MVKRLCLHCTSTDLQGPAKSIGRVLSVAAANLAKGPDPLLKRESVFVYRKEETRVTYQNTR